MADRRTNASPGVELPVLGSLAPPVSDVAVVPSALELRDVSAYYGSHLAVRDVSLDVPEGEITAFIGPSGCGKTTLLRCLNRMNDELPNARHEGQILYRGTDIYERGLTATTVRRAIGMVFQRPNPFPKSIYENVAYAPRALGRPAARLDGIVEESLERAGLWDEVKHKLKKSALGLSGGQQQRLCIARALAVDPDVLLMDEPCSALDPIATLRIEELLAQLKSQVTIVIVTHNLQQAARIADHTAFFTAEATPSGLSTGFLVEHGPTRQIFTSPRDPRTDDYIAGRFG
jgi:phosphate transport system ATP-binding protein